VASPIFDLKNIFIVFGVGAGGNFIAGLLKKIIDSDLTELKIRESGSSHTISNNTPLNFGMISEEHIEFKSLEEREISYLKRIENECANIISPQIIWTHDFTNVPLYKKHFKNSKVLMITHDSYLSRLSSIFMHVMKTFLDTNVNIPLREPYKNRVFNKWNRDIKNEMSSYFSQQDIDTIFNKRETELIAKDIITYFSLQWLVKIFGVEQFLHGINNCDTCIYDFATYPNMSNNSPNNMFIVGENYYDYTHLSDATLSYSYLIENNLSLLLTAIEQLIERPLTEVEIKFVDREFTSYSNAQNKQILSDPIGYYFNAKKIAMSYVDTIRWE
jgi:hypothetical protein